MKKWVLNLDKLHLILIGIILLGVTLFLINRNNVSSNFISNPYQPQLDSLSGVIQRYENKNRELENRYLEYLDISFKYKTQVDSLNKNIQNQRKTYEKQIQDVSNYTSTELYKFITDRYK